MEEKAIVEQALPKELLGKFVILKITPKGNDITEGLYLHLALVSYTTDGENWTQTIKIELDEDGVAYPLFVNGKNGLIVKKLRSLKYDFKYFDITDNAWRAIYAEQLSKETFRKDYPDTEAMGIDEFETTYTDWLEDVYLWMFQKELGLPKEVAVEPGLQIQLYRTYVPPKEGKQWGNIYVSRRAPKDSPVFTELAPGEVKQIPSELRNKLAVLFGDKSEEDDQVPF